MSDDLVKRLRDRGVSETNCLCGNPVCIDAADRIEELEKALDRANRTLVDAFNRIHCLPRTTDTQLADEIGKTRAVICAALKGETE